MHLLKRTLVVFGFLYFIVSPSFSEIDPTRENALLTLYHSIDGAGFEKPPYDLFVRGAKGFYKLKASHNRLEKDILTLIDFRKSANEKRLWIIDLKTNRVLYYSLVAHGRNSGEIYAKKFSNIPNSNQSSLGFYITGSTYMGKHGVSLKLHGVEKGINDKAESRAIVMHGANYVSEAFIAKAGRLGRSFGCPAVPMDIYKEVITELANGSCLFIYYPDQDYLSRTTYREEDCQEEVFTASENR